MFSLFRKSAEMPTSATALPGRASPIPTAERHFVNGNRLAPGAWTPVQNGSLVRFGPVEFSVRLE